MYRFERNQYLEIRELWNANEGEWAGKGAGDTYGAEHLCRLLGLYRQFTFLSEI